VKANITVSSGADAAPSGSVRVTVDGVVVDNVTLGEAEDGKLSITLKKLRSGVHSVRAEFVPGDDTVTGSTSNRKQVWVLF
jgi:hypothetical protein